MMENIRVSKVKVDLPLAVVERTVQVWTNACNYISRVAFDGGCLSNAVQLHQLTYYDVRGNFGLTAQVTANAIRHVASKYTAARTTRRTLKKPIHFRNQAVVLQGGPRGRDFSFTRTGLSISTIDGRIKRISYHGAPRLTEYLSDWKMGDARLFIRKGKAYLSISFKQEWPDTTRPNDAAIGVDRGINYLAVVTDGKRQRFFGGGHVKTVRNHYIQVRSSQQSKLAERKKAQKDTRSIRRALKRLSGKQTRFMRDANHVISKRIIQFAQETGNPTIAIEELKGIRNNRQRKPQRAELNRWAFYQLEQFLTYKANDLGFEVIKIDPRNTSKGCSHCGYVHATNRNRHSFTCKACGYSLHSDLNASRNIRLRGILSRQVLVQDGPPSTDPKARASSDATGKPLDNLGGS